MREERLYDSLASRTRTGPDAQRTLNDATDQIPTPQITYEQITANQNDYRLLAGEFHRLSTDASRTLTGLANVAPGRPVTITNVGGFDLVLAHQNAGSAAPNRIISPTAANYTLGPNESAILRYDGSSQRWRIVAGTGA